MAQLVIGENSYVTVTEADEYLSALYLADEWGSVTPENKLKLLITATRMLDRLPVKYERVSPLQKLKFPCRTDGLGDGTEQAKEACILQAWYLFRNMENITAAHDESIMALKSQNLGAVQIAKSVSGTNPFKKYDPQALDILSKYVSFQFKIGRA